MILYGYNECPYCHRVLQAIERLGIQDQVEWRNTRTHPAHRQELSALAGRTQVPCLVVDGKPMLESADIVRYLEGRFGADAPKHGPFS